MQVSDPVSTVKAASSVSNPVPTTPGSGASTAASNVRNTEQLIGVYSTTVSGQQVAGTVMESNGVYSVSVTHVPGATASGNSEVAAEYNLATVIDELA
jgi:hypothetical protein